MRSYSSKQNSLSSISVSILFFLLSTEQLLGQKPRTPTGGRVAVVADERLAALRAAPNLSARLDQRLSRGRYVAVVGTQHHTNGLTFYLVKVTRRKRGWIQSDALVSSAQAAD